MTAKLSLGSYPTMQLLELSESVFHIDFEKFISLYSDEHRSIFLNYCLCRAVMLDLEFAVKLLKSGITLHVNVLNAICSKFIMNNIVNDHLIRNSTAKFIWYPEIPSKETCLRLLDKYDKFRYQVAIVCILMDWPDVFEICDMPQAQGLRGLCVHTGRIEQFPQQFVSSEFELMPYFGLVYDPNRQLNKSKVRNIYSDGGYLNKYLNFSKFGAMPYDELLDEGSCLFLAHRSMEMGYYDDWNHNIFNYFGYMYIEDLDKFDFAKFCYNKRQKALVYSNKL